MYLIFSQRHVSISVDHSHFFPSCSVPMDTLPVTTNAQCISHLQLPGTNLLHFFNATPLTRKPDGAASRKKGKEKMRDGPPQRTPPVLRGSKSKPVRNKRYVQLGLPSHNASKTLTIVPRSPEQLSQRETDNYEKNKD